jgi:hypothetical protein
MGLREMRCEVVDRIKVTKGTVQWRAFVNTVIIILV